MPERTNQPETFAPSRNSDAPSELYVGYLPVPTNLRRFLRWAVPLAVGAIAASAVLLALSQPDPGPAKWESDRAITLTGVVWSDPYPCLFTDDRGDGKPGVLMLVEPGKHGGARAASLNGVRARATGYQLQRGGDRMLELVADDHALTAEPTVIAPIRPDVKTLGPVTLRGEIVDLKCYLGAMKPGHGKPHKECATLCIRGGIPPVLIVRDDSGGARTYLLASDDGGPLGTWAHPFIADAVEITGELEDRGGLLVLRVVQRGIRRV
jgi:hypothetical protein